MISALTSSQVIRLRHAIQRGIAYQNTDDIVQSAIVTAGLAAEVAARIAADAAEQAARISADNVLQGEITDLQQPRYAPVLLLGGM